MDTRFAILLWHSLRRPAFFAAACILCGGLMLADCGCRPQSPDVARLETDSHSAPTPPVVGSVAPNFGLRDFTPSSASDDSTALRHLSDYRGKPAVLFFFCGCGPCHKLAPSLEKLSRASPPVAVLGITTIGKGHVQQFQRETGTTYPILFDPNYEVAARYDAMECPRVWLVSPKGTVTYTNTVSDAAPSVLASLRQHLSSN